MPNPTDARAANGGNDNRRNIFRWADLPGELRNRIYELTLTATRRIDLVTITKNYDESALPRMRLANLLRHGLAPKLLRINKATYAEGAPVLYANHINFPAPMTFFVFLDNLSAAPRALLKELTVVIRIPEPAPGPPRFFDSRPTAEDRFFQPAFAALRDATNLKHLHLALFKEWGARYAWERFADELWMQAHRWLEAVVDRKDSKEQAVELIDINIFRDRNDDLWIYKDCARLSSDKTLLVRENLLRWLHGQSKPKTTKAIKH